MERTYEIGRHVVYVDEHGVRRDALITVWWSGTQTIPEYVSSTGEPGCNLVIVSNDENRKDSCGRQTEHRTSVVHKSNQVAPGWYWCWPDE